jgi:medium-chain acyl-[acyl-carrier-protein] hydrolase
MTSLVADLAIALLPFADKPFAFFGHSMGALVSFELARELRRSYGLEPVHLFVSGCVAPQRAELIPRVLALAPDQMLEEVRRWGGTPDEVLNDAELRELALVPLRADLALIERYSLEPELPLDCPITAFGGLQDEGVAPEVLDSWRKQSTAGFSMHMFSGGHFFIQTAELQFLEALCSDLNGLAAAEEIRPAVVGVGRIGEAERFEPDSLHEINKSRIGSNRVIGGLHA